MIHNWLERNSILLLVGIICVIAVGGAVEIAPLFWVNGTVEKVSGMRPYTPLELEGRNIYVREGCYVCHSQQIRTLSRRSGTLRPLQPGGREYVRPPLSVGLGAHRPGPGEGRREIFGSMASGASRGSPRGGAGIHHAALSEIVFPRRSTIGTCKPC